MYTSNMSGMTSEFLIIFMFVIDFTVDILYVVYKLISIMYDISINEVAFCIILNSAHLCVKVLMLNYSDSLVIILHIISSSNHPWRKCLNWEGIHGLEGSTALVWSKSLFQSKLDFCFKVPSLVTQDFVSCRPQYRVRW